MASDEHPRVGKATLHDKTNVYTCTPSALHKKYDVESTKKPEHERA
jgi:hypothetical protein